MNKKAVWMVYCDSSGFNVKDENDEQKRVTKILFCSECGQASTKAYDVCPHCGKNMNNPE